MDVKSRVPGKMVEVKVAVGDTVATKTCSASWRR